MFELEYLYEQLKSQTNQQQYIECLNTVMESAYDIKESTDDIQETMQAIDEAAKKKGFGRLNALKAKITSTQKVLEKYKDKALKVNPIGLTYGGFKTFKSDSEINKLHEQAIKYLNSFNPDKATEEQLKTYINDSNNNVQYYKISEIFGNGKKTYKIKDIIISKTEDKNISKSDIANAIKGIESGDKKLKAVQDEQRKNDKEYGDYVRSNGFVSATTKGSIDKLRKNAASHKRALIAIADSTYYTMIIQKYTQELEQYKRIVVKAANYNPRNLKESYMIQDYIDSAYAFIEATEEF